MTKLLVIFAALVLAACVTTKPGSAGTSSPVAKASERVVMASIPEASPSSTRNSGNAIGFIKLEAPGLRGDNTATMIESEIFKYWAQYSGMDTYSYENTLKLAGFTEQMYADNANMMSLANQAEVDYYFHGDVTKSGNEYNVRLGISNASDGRATRAQFTETFTRPQIEDLSLTKKAAMELLEDLGRLTPQARAELSGASREEDKQAAAYEARGLEAARSGDPLVGYMNYVDAAMLQRDEIPKYLIDSLRSTLTEQAFTNNLRASVRSDIQNWTRWREVLEATETLLDEYPPYELGYTTLEVTATNYQRGTADISVGIELVPSAYFNVLQELQLNLNKQGKNPQGQDLREAWGFADWPQTNTRGLKNNLFYQGGNFQATLILRNDSGEEIGRSRVNLPFSSSMRKENGIITGSGSRTTILFKNIHVEALPSDSSPILVVTNVIWDVSNFTAQKPTYGKYVALGFPLSLGIPSDPGGEVYLGLRGELRWQRLLVDASYFINMMNAALDDKEEGELTKEEVERKFRNKSFFDFGASYAFLWNNKKFPWYLASGIGGRIITSDDKSQSGFVPYWKTQLVFPRLYFFYLGYTMQILPEIRHFPFIGLDVGLSFSKES